MRTCAQEWESPPRNVRTCAHAQASYVTVRRKQEQLDAVARGFLSVLPRELARPITPPEAKPLLSPPLSSAHASRARSLRPGHS